MGLLDYTSDLSDAYEEVQDAPHKAELSHELISSAAAYEAAKAYEEHVAANGKPSSHAKAKELVAAFSGAFIDHIAETKGLDFIDKQRAKHQAVKHLDEGLDEEY